MNAACRLIPWLLLGLAGTVAAQTRSATETYSCTTCDGRRLTSDRPIKECGDVPQQVLRADGTVLRTLLPVQTPAERLEDEQARADFEARKKAYEDAVRNDRLLRDRFPDAATHQKERDKALEPMRYAISQSIARLADLERERKPLIVETEFYAGKPLPAKLKAQLDANDAAASAQKELLQKQQMELDAESRKYDEQLAHLRQLWSGKDPGWAVPRPALAAPTRNWCARASGAAAR